jgi:hypothetical protein
VCGVFPGRTLDRLYLKRIGLRPSAPYELFKRRHIHSLCGHSTADSSGDRFLIAALPDESTQAPINVILNWPALLSAR